MYTHNVCQLAENVEQMEIVDFPVFYRIFERCVIGVLSDTKPLAPPSVAKQNMPRRVLQHVHQFASFEVLLAHS